MNAYSFNEFTRHYPGDGSMELVAEASDIGLRPGDQWPRRILVQGKRRPQEYVFKCFERELDGDICGVRYRATDSSIRLELVIIND